jgi:hypothetical protein
MSTRSQLLAALIVCLSLSPAARGDGVTVTDPDPTANPPVEWSTGTPVSVTFSYTVSGAKGFRVKIANAAVPTTIYYNQGQSGTPANTQFYNFTCPSVVPGQATLCTITVEVLGNMGQVIGSGGSKVSIRTSP